LARSTIRLHVLAAAALPYVLLTFSLNASAADGAAAEELAQSSGCFKCHAIAKRKDGPAYRDVAAKYRDAMDAEAKLMFHITSGEMVKFEDGHQEHHKKVKAKTEDEARNLVRWILAQPGGTKY
jgi:cytochrome c